MTIWSNAKIAFHGARRFASRALVTAFGVGLTLASFVTAISAFVTDFHPTGNITFSFELALMLGFLLLFFLAAFIIYILKRHEASDLYTSRRNTKANTIDIIVPGTSKALEVDLTEPASVRDAIDSSQKKLRSGSVE